MASPQCFADEVAEAFESDCQEAEWLLRDRARQNQKLTLSDRAFLARLNWSETKQNEEFRRVSQAVTLLAIAGTPAQRQAKEAEAQTAAEVFAKESPKLEAKIQELQTKLNTLERDKRLTEKRVEETREALAKLPNVAPGYVRKRVAAAESLLHTEGIGRELLDAKQRLHELTCILNLNNVYESLEKHIDYGLKRLSPDAVTSTVYGRTVNYGYSPAWPAIKADGEREHAEISARLPELQAAFDTALAEIKKPLIDYFFTNSDHD